ncbi:MAG TPA: hypothetical protein VGH87_15880 [Polyangiaceae bacterium]|nr:hypothetical protein [Polyangiaceae bacterium]
MNDPIRILIAGACASVAGIVLAASGIGTGGGVVTVGGWLLLVAAIHRFGRAGPDAGPNEN